MVASEACALINPKILPLGLFRNLKLCTFWQRGARRGRTSRRGRKQRSVLDFWESVEKLALTLSSSKVFGLDRTTSDLSTGPGDFQCWLWFELHPQFPGMIDSSSFTEGGVTVLAFEPE